MVCKDPVEISGVDNDSKDRTAEIYERCGIRYYKETQHSPGFARNCGLEHSRGKYHICIDSDSLYPKSYVEIFTNHLTRPNVICCYGLWSFIPDSTHSPMQLFIYETLISIIVNTKYNTINRTVKITEPLPNDCSLFSFSSTVYPPWCLV